MKEHNDVKFVYFRDVNGRVITYAFKVVSNKDDKLEFQYGSSACHPNDRFIKKVGRAKAEGRMNRAIAHGLDPIVIEDNRSFGSMYRNILWWIEETLLPEEAPNWWNKNPLTPELEKKYLAFLSGCGYTLAPAHSLNGIRSVFQDIFLGFEENLENDPNFVNPSKEG